MDFYSEFQKDYDSKSIEIKEYKLGKFVGRLQTYFKFGKISESFFDKYLKSAFDYRGLNK